MSKIVNEISPNYWELYSPRCKRHLMIKKIALRAIEALNFAALGAILYLTIAYCPIPTQALLISPFIIGVLGALSYMKFNTFGVSIKNYKNYTNPTVLVGKGLTYLFFGPYAYAKSKIDMNPYHDPHRANEIAHDIKENTFESLSEAYGRHFANFVKYGIIPPEHRQDLLDLYKEYIGIQKEKQYHESNGIKNWHQDVQVLETQISEIEEKWDILRASISPHLPSPALPKYTPHPLWDRVQHINKTIFLDKHQLSKS